jgi:hypothetical protein
LADHLTRNKDAATTNVLFSPTYNIYKYDHRNLIISYCIAIFFTLLCMAVGFFALQYNGVAHSNAFSAIVATTRNPELDEVSKGHSLGALPLVHTSLSLRFGELLRDWQTPRDGGSDKEAFSGHIGFGSAKNVGNLKRGKRYT